MLGVVKHPVRRMALATTHALGLHLRERLRLETGHLCCRAATTCSTTSGATSIPSAHCCPVTSIRSPFAIGTVVMASAGSCLSRGKSSCVGTCSMYYPEASTASARLRFCTLRGESRFGDFNCSVRSSMRLKHGLLRSLAVRGVARPAAGRIGTAGLDSDRSIAQR